MLTRETIIQMFKDMGLEREEVRQHFLELAKLGIAEEEEIPPDLIHITTNSTSEDDFNNAELERHT